MKKYEKELRDETETLKSELSLKVNTGLEELKGVIEGRNKWDEIRRARLREEQGEVFKEVYLKLVTLYSKAKNFNAHLNDEKLALEVKLNEFTMASSDFAECYETKKIWLNDPLCHLIDDLSSKIERTMLSCAAYLSSDSPNHEAELFQSMREAWESLNGEVRDLKVEIEKKFRELMMV